MTLCVCGHPKGRHLHTNLGNVTGCYDCGCQAFSGDGNQMLREITEIIRAFREQYGRGYRLTAHFIPNDNVPRDTIYVMHIPKIHLAGSLREESPNIEEEKDYGIAVHPDTLPMIRAEVNKSSPILLHDNEIAYILAVGSIGDRSHKGGILDTSGS